MFLFLSQINDYHNIISELSNEMVLSELSVAGPLIQEPLESWKDYKNFNQNNHMSLQEFIVHND